MTTLRSALAKAIACLDGLAEQTWPDGIPSTVDPLLRELRQALDSSDEPSPAETTSPLSVEERAPWFGRYQALVSAARAVGYWPSEEDDPVYGGKRTVLKPVEGYALPSESLASRAAAAAGAESTAGGSILAQQMAPDTSPLTHQEIFSTVYHHAAEITRLTAAVPAECAQKSSGHVHDWQPKDGLLRCSICLEER